MPGKRRATIRGIPHPETQEYVKRVLALTALLNHRENLSLSDNEWQQAHLPIRHDECSRASV
jgi:hypothetical protein